MRNLSLYLSDYDGNDSDVVRQPVDFNVPGQGKIYGQHCFVLIA